MESSRGEVGDGDLERCIGRRNGLWEDFKVLSCRRTVLFG